MEVKQQPGKEPHENKAEDILSELDAVLSEFGTSSQSAAPAPESAAEPVPPPLSKSGPATIPFRSQKPLTPAMPVIAPTLELKSIPGGAPSAPAVGEAAPSEPEPVREAQPEPAPGLASEAVEATPTEAAPEVSAEPAAASPQEVVRVEPVPEAPQEPVHSEAISEEVPSDQIRNVVFFYSPGAEAVLGEFLKSLDNMALKVSKKPIYLKRAMVRPWDPGANTSLVIEAIKSSGASATVACLSAYNELQISAFEQALSRAGIFFRLVRAEEAGQRAVAVDLLVDLILIH